MTRGAIFVTGAAAGIGRAVAARFAAADWTVGLYDVDAAAVAATAADIGGHTRTGAFDVTDADGWRSALADFTAAAGQLNVLVNNAGMLRSGPFADIALDQHHRQLAVNVQGLLNGCYLALPYLRAAPGSRVVNLASASALYGQPGLASYAASKAAVRSLTEALDLEWRRLGIGVHDILPLFVRTAMMDDVRRGALSPGVLGVHTTPEQVAEAVWRTVHSRRRFRGPHVFVGPQAKLLRLGTALSPDWLNRLVVARLSRSDSLTTRASLG